MLNWFVLFLFYRQLPATKRLEERINNGYWDQTPEEKQRIEMIRRNLNPDTKNLLLKKADIMSKSEPFEPIKI